MLISNPAQHKDLQNLTLITGGARSGKSLFAEKIASAKNQPVVYLATMQRLAKDGETAARIDIHQARRPAQWRTVEEPLDLSEAISALGESQKVCLIDCLSLWVTNILLASGDDREIVRAQERLLGAKSEQILAEIARQSHIDFIVVTNEVGDGIVPDNFLARTFRDALGTVNQNFARSASEVWLTCVGLPYRLKPPLSPYPPGVML